jgi:TRAP-type mannitol/chloroaromatic compound transport system permease small subunit
MPLREGLQRNPKWPRWIGFFGAILFFGGLAWIAVWDHFNRVGPEWLWSEAHPPFPSQEMVLFGFALLLASGIRVSIRFVRSIFRGRAGHN